MTLEFLHAQINFFAIVISMMPFACNDPSMISPMMILSSLIWVENCENCKLTSSFETILGLFARIDGNVCEL